MAKSSRNYKKPAIIAGSAAAALAVFFGAAVLTAEATRAQYAPPVSEKVQAYYDNPPQIAENEVISVLGDSYTGGANGFGNHNFNWTQVAVKELNNAGYKVVAGKQGSGGSGYVTRGSDGSVFAEGAEKVMNEKTDLAVIFGSINDRGQPLDAIAAGAAAAIDVTRTKAPNAKSVLIVGPAWRTPDAPEDLLAIRDTLAEVAASKGAVFADPIAERWLMDRPELISSDQVHPTNEGHAVMASLMVPHLEKHLTKVPAENR